MSAKKTKTITIPRRVPLEQWGYVDVPVEILESTFFNPEELYALWVEVEKSFEAIRSAHKDVAQIRIDAEKAAREVVVKAQKEKTEKELIPKFVEEYPEEIAKYRSEMDLGDEIPDETIAKILIKQQKKASGGGDKEKVQVSKIGDLNIGDEKIKVTGELVSISEMKEGVKEGKAWKNISVVVDDGTGQLKITLWNDDINIIDGINKGDKVLVKGYKVKEGYQGRGIELNMGKWGAIDKV